MKIKKYKNIKITDITSSEKGCQIAYDVINAINDKKNGSDRDIEYYKYLDNCVKHNIYFDELHNSIKNPELNEINYTTKTESEKLEAFRATLLKSKQTKLKIRKNIFISSGIVAAAILTISFLIYKNQNTEIEYVSDNKEFVNISAPTLITDNGEQYDLNKNTKIASANGQTIDADSKHLKYRESNKTKDTISNNITKYNNIIVPAHHTYKITLSDNTIVTLNANSRLIFPAKFAKTERVVTLVGEGYFEVSKDTKPFVVKLNEIYVKVYGTKFNINARNPEKIKTVLVEGIVGVGANGIEEKILKPNQMLTINSKNKKSEIEEIDAANYIGWLSGSIRFINSNFEDFIDELSSWYGIKIKIKNETLKKEKVNISIKHTMSKSDALTFVEEIYGVKFINEGGHYTVE